MRRLPAGRGGTGRSADHRLVLAADASAGTPDDLRESGEALIDQGTAFSRLPRRQHRVRVAVPRGSGGWWRVRRDRATATGRQGDLKLYWRLALQTRSRWRHIAVLFLVGLLASPLARLSPLPRKIAVDSVPGSRPLPAVLRAVLPAAVVTTSLSGLLGVVAGLAILIALANQLQVAAQKYLTVLAGRSEERRVGKECRSQWVGAY